MELIESHLIRNFGGASFRAMINRRIPWGKISSIVPVRPLDLVDSGVFRQVNLPTRGNEAPSNAPLLRTFLHLRERGAVLGKEQYGYPIL